MKKSERIEFRVTTVERAAYDKARGIVPLGAWIRFVLNEMASAINKAQRRPETSGADETTED